MHQHKLWARRFLRSGGATVVLLAAAATARATPTLSITGTGSPLAATATAGSFIVSLANPGGTEQIAAYTATFQIIPEAGATGGLTIAGLYATQPTNPLYPGQDPSEVTSGSTRGATDSYNTSPFFVTGGDGKNLFTANYTINAGTRGTFDVVFTTGTGPLRTRLTNPAAADIPVAVQNGTITVVPEPGTAGLLAAGGLLCFARRRRSTGVPIRIA
jgi:hypothetical protein